MKIVLTQSRIMCQKHVKETALRYLGDFKEIVSQSGQSLDRYQELSKEDAGDRKIRQVVLRALLEAERIVKTIDSLIGKEALNREDIDHLFEYITIDLEANKMPMDKNDFNMAQFVDEVSASVKNLQKGKAEGMNQFITAHLKIPSIPQFRTSLAR